MREILTCMLPTYAVQRPLCGRKKIWSMLLGGFRMPLRMTEDIRLVRGQMIHPTTAGRQKRSGRMTAPVPDPCPEIGYLIPVFG